VARHIELNGSLTLKYLTVTYVEWRQARGFIAASLLLFIASVAMTIVCSSSMSAAGAMTMPGGWMASMMWLPMCGQTWPGLAASFLGMWIVMMVAMMLPSLMPMLWRYRVAVGRIDATRLDWLSLVAVLGYFFVWSMIGVAVFALGVAAATIQSQFPALMRVVPVTVGVVVLLAGAIQFTHWKAQHLACCQAMPDAGCVLTPETATAWRHGLRLGRHCAKCCGNLMTILLVVGMMDLSAMAIVTIAMTAERLAPVSARVVRVIGWIVLGEGLYITAAANWPW